MSASGDCPRCSLLWAGIVNFYPQLNNVVEESEPSVSDYKDDDVKSQVF